MKLNRRMRWGGRTAWRWAMTAAMLLNGWWVEIAAAQRETRPPEEASPLPQWVCVLLFTGLVIAIAFKNPKRTHLD